MRNLRPKPHTIQWIAPHLSESEIRKIYDMVLSDVIGEDETLELWSPNEKNRRHHQNNLRIFQRSVLSRLFGMDNK